MKLIIFVTIIFQLLTIARADELQGFSTDGCSMYPNGIPMVDDNKWVHCCITHDMSYWVGGSLKEKLSADEELGQCVAKKTNEFHGGIMELGVLAGGLPNTGLPWRWGYGFKNGRSYKEMSLEEKIMQYDRFDGIFFEIENLAKDLSLEQISYLVGRYEVLRYDLALELDIPAEIEMKNYKRRLEILYKIYNGEPKPESANN